MSLELFDTKYKKSGKHNHWLAKIFWVLGLSFTYLNLHLNIREKLLNYEIIHENDKYYYEGYHNHITLGWITINYGT